MEEIKCVSKAEWDHRVMDSTVSGSLSVFRGSCESCYRPAPCRHASEGHCGKLVPSGYFCHHCRTWLEGRRSAGQDNKALKIWESDARRKSSPVGACSSDAVEMNANCFCCPQEEIFSIQEDLSVIVKSRTSQVGPKQTDPEEQEVRYNTFNTSAVMQSDQIWLK